MLTLLPCIYSITRAPPTHPQSHPSQVLLRPRRRAPLQVPRYALTSTRAPVPRHPAPQAAYTSARSAIQPGTGQSLAPRVSRDSVERAYLFFVNHTLSLLISNFPALALNLTLPQPLCRLLHFRLLFYLLHLILILHPFLPSLFHILQNSRLL